jgi:hypothetical protein
MQQLLIETMSAQVARIDGVLSFRAWDDVADDLGPWHPVDSFVITSIEVTFSYMNDQDLADTLSGNSVCNLSNETALAIVRAVRKH